LYFSIREFFRVISIWGVRRDGRQEQTRRRHESAVNLHDTVSFRYGSDMAF